MHIECQLLRDWCDGSSSPEIHQLESLARVTGRPLAAMFLNEPPMEPPMPTDLRTMPGNSRNLSHETILVIRRAMWLQESASALIAVLSERQDSAFPCIGLHHSPESIAAEMRADVEASAIGNGSENADERFVLLRNWMEAKGIFVFLMSMPPYGPKGFVLSDRLPQVIVVNSSDGILMRTYSMAHEFGHLLLHQSGLCHPGASSAATTPECEVWCDRFDSSLLLRGSMNQALEAGSPSPDEIEESLMRQGAADEVSMMDGGGPDQESATASEVISHLGLAFVSLVSEGLSQEVLTTSDALGLLSVKLKDLDEVLSSI
jgi:Zn-dependent peptidase ImmA (M78 family)